MKRLIADTLEKMRMPSTTMTAVCSCEPTPSWLPRNTSSVAVTTLARKEITNTRSEKLRGTQQGVKSSDHHNRQIRLHDDRNVRLDEHADDDADD